MNKKLVALAVGGAFALPFAAQAQTANVTLYGRLNVDLEFINGKTCQNGATGGAGAGAQNFQACTNTQVAPNATPNQISNPTVNRLSSNSSRFGMRGTESLGGGLNAVFQIESNVSGDTGNSSGSGLASRETFVGLQGSWGRVTYGNFLAPQDDLHPIFGNAPTLTTSIRRPPILALAVSARTRGLRCADAQQRPLRLAELVGLHRGGAILDHG